MDNDKENIMAMNMGYCRFQNTLAAHTMKPRTELGRRLLEYRKAALAKGMKTLSADEIDEMVKTGRGVSA